MRSKGFATKGCAGLAALATLTLLACQPSSQSQQDIQDIKSTQKEILAKLTAIEKGQKAAAPARPPSEDFDKVYKLDVAGSPILGNPKAKVTLVEFSDFECPFCARAIPEIKKLIERYPDDVRVVFKHFPLSFHQNARPTALASMAAQEAGCFWEFHDKAFDATNSRSLAAGKAEEYARAAGCDVTAWKSALDSNKADYEKRITADMRLGQQSDVRGTPTLYIGGKKVRNRSADGMAAMVDAILKEQPS